MYRRAAVHYSSTTSAAALYSLLCVCTTSAAAVIFMVSSSSIKPCSLLLIYKRVQHAVYARATLRRSLGLRGGKYAGRRLDSTTKEEGDPSTGGEETD